MLDSTEGRHCGTAPATVTLSGASATPIAASLAGQTRHQARITERWKGAIYAPEDLEQNMIPTLQTFFGLTMPVSTLPIASDTARALAKRISDAARAMDEQDVPVAIAAGFRRDAERYLAVRRTRELRLPTWLESTCDDNARTLMRLTANTPPQLNVSERLVA